MVSKHLRYFLFGGITNNPAMNILGELIKHLLGLNLEQNHWVMKYA